MKEEASQVDDIREHPIHRWRGPPSPMGKAKRRRLRRPKRKPTPPRCARQPLPREGARVDTPSFLWKEVARSAGGWLRSFRLRPTPCPSGIPLPREGGWYEMTGISTLSRCQSKSGPRIGVRQSFQPASVRWFYCTHFGQKTQGKS